MQVESSVTPVTASLWDFAVSVYDHTGVEEACLALQDRFGVNVNMIMFCTWLAASNVSPLDLEGFLAAALKISSNWQRMLIGPLRACRRGLKVLAEGAAEGIGRRGTSIEIGALPALREQVKKCELEAERLHLSVLASLADGVKAAPAGPVARQMAVSNLTVYFSAAGVTLDPLGQSHVTRILDAAFGK